MKLKKFDNKIPKYFYESSLGFIAATINELDLFEHDGLLEKFPLGKLANYLIDKSIKIKDLNNSFNDAFSLAYYFSFRHSIFFFKIHLKGNNLKEINAKREISPNFKFSEISFKNFEENKEILDFYSNTYSLIMQNAETDEFAISKTIARTNSLIILFFYDLLENYPKRYATLIKKLGKKSFSLAQDDIKIEKYYKHIKSDFEQPLLYNSNGLSLKELFISQGFAIHKKCLSQVDFLERDVNCYTLFDYKKSLLKIKDFSSYDSLFEVYRNITKGQYNNLLKFINKHHSFFNLDYYKFYYEIKQTSNSFLLSDSFNNQLLSSYDETKDKTTEFINEFTQSNFFEKNFYFKSNKNFIIILGYPGQGKSTLCKKIAYNYISNSKHFIKPVFFIKLRNIENEDKFIESPLDEIKKYLSKSLPTKYLDSNFTNGIFILDGLDELAIRSDISLDIIDEIVGKLSHLSHSDTYTNIKIILTSRYGYLNIDKLKPEDYILLNLSDFTIEDQINWLNTYRKYDKDCEFTDKDIIYCNAYSHLKELLCQPLMLHMIATTNYKLKTNSSKSEIYNNLFNAVIDRAYEENQIYNIRNIGKSDLRVFLREIAYFIYASEKDYITNNEILALEAANVFVTRLGRENLIDSIKGLLIAFYFKQTYNNSLGEYSLEFLHKSLYEYLASEKLFNEIVRISTNAQYSYKDIFSKIFSLLERIDLTKEVEDYLKELLLNTEDSIKASIYECLSKVISFYFKEYRMPKLFSERNFFISLWSILSTLGIKTDYFNLANRKMLEQLLQSIFFTPNAVSLVFDFQDFSGINLSGLNFNRCSFIDTNFENCKIERAVFNHCNLSESRFINAKMNFIHLRKCAFSNSYFKDTFCKDAFLNNSNFENIEIDNTSFFRTDFSDCNFRDSIVKRSYFYESILTSCDFTRGVFENNLMRYANLKYSNYDLVYNKTNKIEWAKMDKELLTNLLCIDKDLEKCGLQKI